MPQKSSILKLYYKNKHKTKRDHKNDGSYINVSASDFLRVSWGEFLQLFQVFKIIKCQFKNGGLLIERIQFNIFWNGAI